MGKDESHTCLRLLGPGALRSAVQTGSHLWPLRVQEAVLLGWLRWRKAVIVQTQQRDSRLRWVNVNQPLASQVELTAYCASGTKGAMVQG